MELSQARRRLGQWIAMAAVLLSLLPALPGRAAGPAEVVQPVSPDVVEALKGLKEADSDARKKTYDLLAAKGDARLIPALRAYKVGSLLLRDGRLAIFGERLTVADRPNSVLPLIDAITGQPINGEDGKPLYFDKPDLSKALHAPRALDEKNAVSDLIASLSLLDPDPAGRIASIRDAAERAARAIPDPADSARLLETLEKCSAVMTAHLAQSPNGSEASAVDASIKAIATAAAERPASLLVPAPTESTISTLKGTLRQAQAALATTNDTSASTAISDSLGSVSLYSNRLEQRKKVLDELPKTRDALKRQLDKDPTGRFVSPLREAIASIELVIGDPAQRLAAAHALGTMGTSRASNLLEKLVGAADRSGDHELHDAAVTALSAARGYQARVHFIQNTFAGLSAGSILVLMALGLSIIFGLMGVINMAQGEFMMVGAFATYVVAEGFKRFAPGAYDYYLIVAIPGAFLVAGLIGFVFEWLVIRHLYGRPLDAVLATWGIGLVLVWAVRRNFGDNISLKPPRWMEGGWEVAPDIVLPLNRVYIIVFCAICIAVVYLVVNRTKLGLLLRATTQNREMAAALGVPTRRVDGLTFAFGAGLAGLAGVAVPLYDKIKPDMGKDYIVDCFMVVVVGGVGKVAGAVWAGFGLGFIGKYLEPILGAFPSFASGASVIGKVLVLVLIIIFLQWRPQGLFPPKGRNADA